MREVWRGVQRGDARKKGKGCHQAALHPPCDGRLAPRRSSGEEASALTSGLGRTTRSIGRSRISARMEAVSGPRGGLGAGPG